MANPYLYLPSSVYYFPLEPGHSPMHLHLHAEIVYVSAGRLTLHTETDSYPMAAGDACLLFPNQPHGFTSTPSSTAHTLNFTPDYCAELSDVLLTKTAAAPVFSLPDGGREFYAIYCAAAARQSITSMWSDTACRALTLSLACIALEHLTLTEPATLGQRSVRLIVRYCMERYTAHVSLDEMSREIHVSKYHISHLFSSELHTSFPEYIRFLRVSRAKYLMAYYPSMSVTEVAFACGFESLRTFHRAFSALCGVTPLAYRAAALAGAVVPDETKNEPETARKE